ncbi:MAG TPA: thioredoxin [Aggregatilineaceae bacterium]|nr:thioredoxin [Aggregatilineaceae bacterium]
MARFDTPLNTNDQSIDRVVNAGLPVALIIGNGAPLDASLEESLRQVAQADAGRLIVARLNAKENPQTAARAAGPLPELITFRDGQEVAHCGGVTSRTLREHVDYLLGRGPRPTPEPSAPPKREQAHGIAKPVHVSDATFQREVLESDLPVLVDLWAPWCGPCHMIAPIVEKVARDYAGRLKVTKLNVDENPGTSGRYFVQAIPTLLIFRDGRVVDRIVGAAPEPLLRGKVDAALRQ